MEKVKPDKSFPKIDIPTYGQHRDHPSAWAVYMMTKGNKIDFWENVSLNRVHNFSSLS